MMVNFSPLHDDGQVPGGVLKLRIDRLLTDIKLMCSFPVDIFPLSFQFLVIYSYVYFSMSPPIFEKLVLTYVEQKESEFKRFPF